MSIDSTWQSIRERIGELDAEQVLVTPDEERVFTVQEAGTGWLEIAFRDGEERTLPREQFARLLDQVETDGLDLDSLPPGVDPYVSVLSLAPEYAVDGGTLRPAREDEYASPPPVGETPFVRSRWDVRRPPERVHDDALLLAELLERHGETELEDLPTEGLVDLYVLLSDVQRGSDDLRKDVSGELVDDIGPGGREHGQYGTVNRVHRKRRRLKDDEEILDALDDAGVPHEWVLGVDRDKLDVVLATTNVDEDDVYDHTDTYYVQKTGVESEAKRSRLQGLKQRLAEAGGEDADELREEIEELEDRIDEVLSAP